MKTPSLAQLSDLARKIGIDDYDVFFSVKDLKRQERAGGR